MELNIKGASKDEILKKLFLSTLYLSAFTFGGGYVIVTLMKTKFVDQYHWIDEEEMLDLVARSHCCKRGYRCRLQAGWPDRSLMLCGCYSNTAFCHSFCYLILLCGIPFQPDRWVDVKWHAVRRRSSYYGSQL